MESASAIRTKHSHSKGRIRSRAQTLTERAARCFDLADMGTAVKIEQPARRAFGNSKARGQDGASDTLGLCFRLGYCFWNSWKRNQNRAIFLWLQPRRPCQFLLHFPFSFA